MKSDISAVSGVTRTNERQPNKRSVRHSRMSMTTNRKRGFPLSRLDSIAARTFRWCHVFTQLSNGSLSHAGSSSIQWDPAIAIATGRSTPFRSGKTSLNGSQIPGARREAVSGILLSLFPSPVFTFTDSNKFSKAQ